MTSPPEGKHFSCVILRLFDILKLMKPQISVITLAVDNLEKSLAFYRDGLGLPSKGIIATEFHDEVSGADGAVAFFELQGGIILALYPRTDLAKDAKQEMKDRSSIEFSLGYVAKNKEEVDAFIKQAEKAGAIITEQPRERPWGIYSGYFKDPDGHLWEIIWNPESVSK